MDRCKAYSQPVRWLKVVTDVARIRCERLRLDTGELRKNFRNLVSWGQT